MIEAGAYDELFARVHAAMEREEWSQAVTLAKLLTEMSPTSANGWMALGEACFFADRLDEAAPAFERCAALTPAEASAHGYLGKIFVAKGDWIGAANAFGRAIACGALGHPYVRPHLEVLLEAGRFAQCRQALEAARPGFNPKALDNVEARLLINETMATHWTADGDGFLPTTRAAVEAMEEVLDRVGGLSMSDEVREQAESVRVLTEEARRRRYDGGFAVPIAAGLVGLILGWLTGFRPQHDSTWAAVAYLASVPLYLHAARVQGYRWNARRLKGETGAGQFLTAASRDDGGGAKDVASGFLMGFCCLGFVGPLVVGYHYVRNYLMD